MKNRIIKLDEKNFKVLGFSETQVIFSSKKHTSFDTLKDSVDNSGLLESVKSVLISSITLLSYNEKQQNFKIAYTNEKGKTKKKSLIVSDSKERELFVAEIASFKEGLKKSVISERKIKPLLGFSALIALIAVGGWWLRNIAINAEAGGHLEIERSRRSGILQLIIDGAESIGSTGVSIIVVLALLFALYKTYDRFTNPANEISYKEN